MRDALLHAFNFEFVNQTLNGGAFPRRASYFANSELGMGDGAGGGAGAGAAGAVRGQPGAGGARRLCAAGVGRLAAEPGQHAGGGEAARGGGLDGRRTGCCGTRPGEPFAFEILLQQGQSEAVANIFADALRQLGIEARVKLVDQAQYNARRNDYDYDMIVNAWNMSLSPGNEQTLYWGEAGVTMPGTRNYMGDRQPGGGGDDRRRCWRPATRRSSRRRCRRSTGC